MAGKKSFQVLSRIRRSGVVYALGTENDTVELGEKEAERFFTLKCIGEGSCEDEDGGDGDFDLQTALKSLITEGHDVKSLNMAETAKLLGKNARGVKRNHISEALAEIEKAAAG